MFKKICLPFILLLFLSNIVHADDCLPMVFDGKQIYTSLSSLPKGYGQFCCKKNGKIEREVLAQTSVDCPYYKENGGTVVFARTEVFSPDNASLEHKINPSVPNKYIEIIDLPREPNIVSAERFLDFYKEDLDRIVKSLRNSEMPNTWLRIESVSETEARKYFESYLRESLTVSEIESGMLEEILGPKFMGIAETKIANDPASIFSRDPYISTTLKNVFTFKIRKGHEDEDRGRRTEYFRSQISRSNPELLLLDPNVLYATFLECAGHIGTGKAIREQEQSAEQLFSFLNLDSFRGAKKEFISEHYFGLPSDPVRRKSRFLNHDFGPIDRELIRSIYRSARTMMEKTKQGDTFVIFGNTPYFIGRALKFLADKIPTNANYREIIDFPFSGIPNAVRPGCFPNKNNLVTEERLVYLKKQMKEKGLSPENKNLLLHTTYFVDVIGTGGGIAYVIEEILRDFRNLEKPYPHFKILAINKINVLGEDPRNGMIAKQNPDSNGQTDFYFPSIAKPHFKMGCEEVVVKGHFKLDLHEYSPYRSVPNFNPSFWREDFDGLNQPKSGELTTLLEYFDINIQALKDQE